MKKILFVFLLMSLCLPAISNAKLFISKCGGKAVKGVSLTKACKKHPGKTVVRCWRKCAKRKLLKCVKRVWKLKSAKVCKVHSKKSQMKARNCSLSQLSALKSAYSSAKSRALRIKRGVEAELRKKHSKSTKKQLKRVKKYIGKIINKLNRRVKFICKGKKGGCKGTVNAHTVILVGNRVRICAQYFKCKDTGWRSGVIVHELAHKAGARDIQYFSQCSTGKSTIPPKSLKDWSKNADTYEYWARFGFCVPGKTCR